MNEQTAKVITVLYESQLRVGQALEDLQVLHDLQVEVLSRLHDLVGDEHLATVAPLRHEWRTRREWDDMRGEDEHGKDLA
jgi:16S rRNA C1402 (ribose-2'-O) methylase RsmI